jgi:sialate O-acetylesterase
VDDEEGRLWIIEHAIVDNSGVALKLSRELKGRAFIHGAYEMNPGFLIPCDSESRLPMLAFYGIEIE